MSDNINPYTGDEPINPYEQQPSYAQDFPESDPYTKDAYNDVFDVTEPVRQETVAPPPIPGQGYNHSQFNGSASPVPTPAQTPQNPYTGGINPAPAQAQAPQNPYTGGQNTYTTPSSTPGGSYNDDGRATGGLVCSIISILCCGVILAPIGIALSIGALRENNQSSKAKAGIIVGIISFILSVIATILIFLSWSKIVEAAM